MYRFNATGIKPTEGGDFVLIPAGWYPFRVQSFEERDSKSGDYQVVVKLDCMDPRYREARVTHYVTFLSAQSKGAGMSMHWLSCLGEPHEGMIDIEPKNWVGKTLMAKITVDKYMGKDGNERESNKIKAVSPIKEDSVSGPSDDDPFKS